MPKAIDRVGARYGRLVVVGTAGHDKHRQRLWFCLCDCGATCTKPASPLVAGATKSCGCLHLEAFAKYRAERAASIAARPAKQPRPEPGPVTEVGVVFGQWTVIAVPLRRQRKMRVSCRCACGREKLVLWETLRNGGSRSCWHCGRVTAALTRRHNPVAGPMRGRRHAEETLAKMRVSQRKKWDGPSSPHRTPARTTQRAIAMSERMRARRAAGLVPTYAGSKGGRRADLGEAYFRSRWEANYARYLNLAVARGAVRSWTYEPHTFVFPKPEGSVRSYTPDFRVVLASGAVEWHEVKGWMCPKSLLRGRMMKEQFPLETVRLVRESFFKNCVRYGIAAQLPQWEMDREKRT